MHVYHTLNDNCVDGWWDDLDAAVEALPEDEHPTWELVNDACDGVHAVEDIIVDLFAAGIFHEIAHAHFEHADEGGLAQLKSKSC